MAPEKDLDIEGKDLARATLEIEGKDRDSKYCSQSSALLFSRERGFVSTPFFNRAGGEVDELVIEPLRVVWSEKEVGGSL